jgi:LCP family protein required for cell wall assembly
VGSGAAPVRHASRHRSHPIARMVVMAAAAALGFGLVFAQAVAGSLSGSITTADIGGLVTATPDAPTDTDAVEGDPLNILLLGSDVRDDENGAIGGRDALGMRSDATLIAHISSDRSRVQLVSIPRDLQVEIADCTLYDGTTKDGWYGDFNAAFANGGEGGHPAEAAACTINTIHEAFDLRIDHFAVVDFTGYIGMVDALGGIPMCVPQRIVSKDAELDVEAGPQVFDGWTALGYARLRTAEVGDVSGSDLQRITRQQQLLEQTLRTATSKNLFTDTAALTQFLRAGAESLTTDEQLGSLPFMVDLGLDLRGLRASDVTFATLPWEYTDDRNNVVLTEGAEVMLDDLRHDRPLSVQAEGDATSEWDDGMADPVEPSAEPSDEPGSGDVDPTQEPESVEDLLAHCAV